jgi:hypothetical protein
MNMTMNGSKIDFSLEGETDVAGLLTSLDSWLEDRGFVMVSLSVDGEECSLDIDRVKDRSLSSIENVDIAVEPLAGYRALALERASLWASRAASVFSPDSLADASEIGKLCDEGRVLLDSRSGFLDPDELSLLEWIASALLPRASGGSRGLSEPSDAAARAQAISASLASRARELRDPAEAARKAVRDFATLRPRLFEMPVLLQTGRDREAMAVISDFADFFSRSVRLIPILSSSGLGLEAEDLGGKDPAEFYAGLNRVLSDFIDAFSAQDTVLVGDLCEYEILPQLDALFSGVEARLGKEGDE